MAWLMQDVVREDEERAQRELARREAEQRQRYEEIRAAADYGMRQLKERKNQRLAGASLGYSKPEEHGSGLNVATRDFKTILCY